MSNIAIARNVAIFFGVIAAIMITGYLFSPDKQVESHTGESGVRHDCTELFAGVNHAADQLKQIGYVGDNAIEIGIRKYGTTNGLLSGGPRHTRHLDGRITTSYIPRLELDELRAAYQECAKGRDWTQKP